MKMPVMLREAISALGLCEIDKWWSGLEQPARQEILELWSACSDAYRGSGSNPNVLLEGEFVDGEEADQGWHSDYYEYLVNHEIYLFRVPGIHICTRHPAARSVARRGLIPAGFECPFGDSNCPMRKVLNLAPGKSLRLRLSQRCGDVDCNATLL